MQTSGFDINRLLEDTMAFRVARQSILATNVANVDTPGYKRSDLEFSQTLDQASLRLTATSGAHRQHASQSGDPWTLKTERVATRGDGNGINLDHEAIELNRNSGAFTELADFYARLAFMTRTAITGNSG